MARQSLTIGEQLIHDVAARIDAGGPVRRALPLGGRLYIDRPVPFLCVYRHPATALDAGTRRLVTGMASYLIGSRDRRLRRGQAALVQRVVERLQHHFGAFLLVEVWADRAVEGGDDDAAPEPGLARVYATRAERGHVFAHLLANTLATDRRLRDPWRARAVVEASRHPARLPPILSAGQARALGCTRLGLEVPVLYRDPETETLYPVVLRTLRRVVDVALRKTAFEFLKRRTSRKPDDYRALGRKALARNVRQVDAQLSRLARGFDFLLSMTPTNLQTAWHAFRRTRFERAPEFVYRHLTVDVSDAKRRLFSLPIDRIEDLTMADLLRDKQFELDRQLTVLGERGSPRVLHASAQLYGRVDRALRREAETVIEMIPPGGREGGRARSVTASEFAELAARELHALGPGLPAGDVGVEVREDLDGGLMVSRGRLLVGARSRFPRARVEALLQHEVGTHVLTFLNGQSQRLQLLGHGLADYDGTQEGLAVLAEHLVGGMSKPRLRLLAGRVFAAHAIEDGASFIETFRLLLRYGFGQQAAFTITARVYRGGGLTKDAVYLRGLLEVLDYLRDDGSLELLYVGKIALRHVTIMRELLARGIIAEAPLLPRFLADAGAQDRLQRVRRGLRPHDLIV